MDWPTALTIVPLNRARNRSAADWSREETLFGILPVRQVGGKDFIDYVAELLRAERPDLDFESIGAVDRLLRIAQQFEKQANVLCRSYGVSFWAFTVLATLRRAGPPYELSPTALYRSAMVTSGAVTKRVTELERDGFVSRKPDPGDGRSTLVHLTAKGRRLTQRLVPAYIDLERELLSVLSVSEQRRLGDLLRPLLLELEGPVEPSRSTVASRIPAAASKPRRPPQRSTRATRK